MTGKNGSWISIRIYPCKNISKKGQSGLWVHVKVSRKLRSDQWLKDDGNNKSEDSGCSKKQTVSVILYINRRSQ